MRHLPSNSETSIWWVCMSVQYKWRPTQSTASPAKDDTSCSTGLLQGKGFLGPVAPSPFSQLVFQWIVPWKYWYIFGHSKDFIILPSCQQRQISSTISPRYQNLRGQKNSWRTCHDSCVYLAEILRTSVRKSHHRCSSSVSHVMAVLMKVSLKQ